MGYGFINDYLMKTFNVQSATSKTIIIVGLVIAVLPMIFKIDVFDISMSWQKSFILFWKKSHYKMETVKQVSFFGLIPIKTQIIKSVHTIDNPPFSKVAGEIAEVVTSFIPGINSWISLLINIIRSEKAK